MKICFLGNTHLTLCSAVAAARRGFEPIPEQEIAFAELIVIAQDVRTGPTGERYLGDVALLLAVADSVKGVPIIIASQVPPGYCRSCNSSRVFHYPETLRIKDASDRALNPDYMVVGCINPLEKLPDPVQRYMQVFTTNVLKMTYESAEFSKIAVNTFLASQVDTTNRLSDAAEKCGATWGEVRMALERDKRIGPHAYLTPGNWKESLHLLRDSVTLKEIEDA